MLGNDIVDLELANIQSNWRRKGYLDKIFNQTEQQQILSAAEPDECVWKLWSLKEAAYKIYNKQTGIRTFEPRLILCDLAKVASASGRVRIKNEVYFTKTIVTSNYVHSTAALNEQDLQRSKTDIYRGNAKNFDYHTLNPKSISHHGDYLALVDFC
ncbi:MAG: 4-phosphopantetheinyl transferase family protein [Pedobacter sp.]|nr:4-phosphopantetheinyl transferase family protein [Pedobacter sp.]